MRALAGCVGVIACTTVAPAVASARLFPVGGDPEHIAFGPDHAAWFTDLLSPRHYGRVTRQGEVTHYLLPHGEWASGIASGRGYVWITACCPNAIFRITPYSGGHHRFRAPNDAGTLLDQPAIGPDGAIWFTETWEGRNVPSAVGRMTIGGKFSKYDLPSHRNHWLGEIAAGPGKALWFLDLGKLGTRRNNATRAVWRFTLNGQFTRFDLPGKTDPLGIASGGSSAWVLEDNGRASKIVRFSKTGSRRWRYPVTPRGPEDIVRGRDAMWFSNPTSTNGSVIARIDFAGKIRDYTLPDYQWAGDLAVSPNGDVWYSDSLDSAVGVLTP